MLQLLSHVIAHLPATAVTPAVVPLALPGTDGACAWSAKKTQLTPPPESTMVIFTVPIANLTRAAVAAPVR
jgi:hypothetical protein